MRSIFSLNNVVSIQYNGGLLPDIILLTQCCSYYHRHTFDTSWASGDAHIHTQQYAREIRNGLCGKESVIFRDFGGTTNCLHIINLFYCVLKMFCFVFVWCQKKNQNAPKPSKHPPVRGEKMSKRLGDQKRLQIQNIFMAFDERIPRWK